MHLVELLSEDSVVGLVLYNVLSSLVALPVCTLIVASLSDILTNQVDLN